MSAAQAAFEVVSLKVARAYSLPHETLTKFPWKVGSRTVSAARRIVMIQLRGMGYSLPEIGEAMGINHTTVLRHVRQSLAQTEEHLVMRMKAEIEAEYAAEDLVMRVPGERLTWRELYDRVVDAYRLADDTLRPILWERNMKWLFPHSWQRQQPPRLA